MSKKQPPPPPASKPLQIPNHITDGIAREEYIRVVRTLGNKLTPVDRSLLADYAITYADVIRLSEEVETEGHKLTGPKGGEYLNPTTTLVMHKQSLLASLRRDLFFTPKSRGEKSKPTGKAMSIKDALNVDDDDES